ncbi:hypothetical protein C2E21_3873 [Chlorella sorokiniana]|uniref:Sulfotransferase n=1 Tax=Chlorella sorokiniana TaxID=3076 RepID=A0A2P6TT17_CHLSO|nr:hypothetical protein C2E21_3873 [Chlorella sorokiniana]|eukprot:PRW57183.1 hypothetical protein C2E21_3873 [Chlorella sorokiniana]
MPPRKPAGGRKPIASSSAATGPDRPVHANRAASAAARHRQWLPAAAAVLLLAAAAPWLARLAAHTKSTAPAAGTAGAAPPITLHTPVRLHGPVKKHGPLAMLSLLGGGARREDLPFPPAWQRQRLAGHNPRPPPLCTILWNDSYRIIFLKCPKNAGNSVAHYFGARWQGSAAPTALHVLEPPWDPRLVDHLLRKWESYTVIAFVRHPLRRAHSQYAFLVPRMARDPSCYVSWDAFCQDPFLLGDKCAAHPQCCKVFNIADQYFHLMPQASCLITESGQLAVDFVGRVEAFDQDFSALLAHLNAREGLPKAPVRAAKVWNANQLGPCQDDAAAAHCSFPGSSGG